MYKNSKHTVLFPLLLAAGVVLGLVLGQYLGRNTTTSQLKGMLSRMALPNNKLSYTLSLIENQYVDSVSMDSLAEHVIPLLVKELDPHSVYIPAAEMQALNEPLEGEFDGIGVVFNMATDTVIVLNVIPQGPSDKAGVKAGDNDLQIVVAGNDASFTVTALFDNLGKGASGAAIQNMNIVLGAEETLGLHIGGQTE